MAAFKFRINERDTEENLELRGFKTVKYNQCVIAVGYYLKYYAALYEFPGDSRSCEAPMNLVFVSADIFEDEGHAVRAMFSLIEKID